MRERDPLSALSLVLRSVDAVRNSRALFVLLGTFASAGLLVSMAEASLARHAGGWGPLQAAAALFVAFYGGNAAGILVMDDARGRQIREIPEALRTSLANAHRRLLALLLVFMAIGVLAGGLLGLFWLSRVAVSGPLFGPVLFGLAVPLGVLMVGLAAPAVWSGAGALQVVRRLFGLIRDRLLTVVLLTAGMGVIVTSVVIIGRRVIAELGVRVIGVDVPPQQLMAGLFGHGLRSLGAVGVPAGSTGHAAAALIGGGMVFVFALLLPGLVYVRGTCAVWLALTEEPPSPS